MSRDLERLCERIDEETDADARMTRSSHMGSSGAEVPACEVQHGVGSDDLQIFENHVDPERNDFYTEYGDLAVTFDAYDVLEHGATQISFPLRGDPQLYFTHTY